MVHTPRRRPGRIEDQFDLQMSKNPNMRWNGVQEKVQNKYKLFSTKTCQLDLLGKSDRLLQGPRRRRTARHFRSFFMIKLFSLKQEKEKAAKDADAPQQRIAPGQIRTNLDPKFVRGTLSPQFSENLDDRRRRRTLAATTARRLPPRTLAPPPRRRRVPPPSRVRRPRWGS